MKKSKIVWLILVLLIIINILIMSVLIKKRRASSGEVIKSPTAQEFTQAKSLYVKNSSSLSAMKIGEISQYDLLAYTDEYITKFLPDIYKQINNDVDFTEEYFARKKATIYKYSHIYKYTDFMELIDTIKKSEINFDEYNTIEFVSSTNNDKEVVINCELTYEEGKTVNLQLTYVGSEINGTKLEN